MKEQTPIAVYQKNADIEKNRVILPKKFITKFGKQFYMEVYDDYIKIIPIKKG